MTAALPCPRRVRLAALSVAALLVLSTAPAAAGRFVSVIVMGWSAPASATDVRGAGGFVDASLPVLDGVLAHVPESAVAGLSRRAVVVRDRTVRMQGSSYGDGLVSAYPPEVGAPALWRDGEAGKKVTVALVDTGVADVPDLGGRVIARADLTSEQNGQDSFGHGTFMAGLIAGNGASSGGRYVGVAPEAKLMSVKVAGGDGITTLGQVLVGVQVVDSSAKRFDVGVMLLALDSGSPLPPELDPLSRALRRVWSHGVTVVVPAGNSGPELGSVSAPGEDPVLLTAGSVNDLGTPQVLDDSVSEFSGRGPTRWGGEKPDVAAPGEHLVSLRAPGSTIDRENPAAVVEGSYFKGTGTSMSAAVTAGAAALLLGRRGEMDPDQVKAVLMGSANPIPAGDADTVGAGIVNAADAAALDAPEDLPQVPDEGDGESGDGPGKSAWTKDGRGGYSLDARQWAGNIDEAARQWAARQWADEDFSARQWAARQWAARQWAARQWAARQARQWSFEEWAARQWSARQWSSVEWVARQWSARQWSARQWSARQWSASAFG
ncbi:MAG: S8 family serine peptidase [Acidobacteria bacterium]|nr:S8 family serine peptidase [Acidobacteriota bacterium]